MPAVTVELDPAPTGPAVNGSDAVFAAVAAARWLADGLAGAWPVDRGLRAALSGAPAGPGRA